MLNNVEPDFSFVFTSSRLKKIIKFCKNNIANTVTLYRTFLVLEDIFVLMNLMYYFFNFDINTIYRDLRNFVCFFGILEKQRDRSASKYVFLPI